MTTKDQGGKPLKLPEMLKRYREGSPFVRALETYDTQASVDIPALVERVETQGDEIGSLQRQLKVAQSVEPGSDEDMLLRLTTFLLQEHFGRLGAGCLSNNRSTVDTAIRLLGGNPDDYC